MDPEGILGGGLSVMVCAEHAERRTEEEKKEGGWGTFGDGGGAPLRCRHIKHNQHISLSSSHGHAHILFLYVFFAQVRFSQVFFA